MHTFTKAELEKAKEVRRRNAEAHKELKSKKKEAEEKRLAYALDTMRLPDLLTTKQAAKIMKVTSKCIRDWIEKGKLNAYRFPWKRSRLYVRTEELKELEKKTVSKVL